MSKNREIFLREHWAKYPETPRGALRFGRVYKMRVGNYNLSEWVTPESSDFKGSDLLVDGDIVAIMTAGKFALIAPNLTADSCFYTLENDPWTKKRLWFEYQQHVRDFFKEKRFLEVKTPTLVKCPGTEPSLDVFSTEFVNGSTREKFFLPTSPEINLKKLLALGAERIYEIASVFRNGEKSESHHFEFTMLEWYRSYTNLSTIKHDMIELIEHTADKLKVARPKEVLTFTMEELFQKYCDFKLTPRTSEDELKQLAAKLNVDVKSATTIDDYFYLIFMEKIENQWPPDRLVFVEKYPPYQAALARLDQNGWGDRFEAYWNGLELANAFHELNDPEIQRARAKDDLRKKKQMGKEEISLDETFFEALDQGMPPSSGIAVGLERLYMALKNIKNIDQI
ncbi:MAG: EF-P lysine aminoacylase GenX [Moraxellaceae bacterium]|nr:EF-P lysine aminoacylase GenX [Pseudobdellovibrionaceae bacterium]